jgi:hypothetical protein
MSKTLTMPSRRQRSTISSVTPSIAGERRGHDLQALVELLGRQDVDVPAGQPRRQAHVLPALADGQAELVVAHHHRRPPSSKHSEISSTSAGLRALANQDLADDSFQRTMSIFSPLSSSTMFLMRLPAHADARADRVDLVVHDETAIFVRYPGLAGHRLDLDDALGDLGHLDLEQPLDEVRVRTAQHDLDLAARVAHVKDQAAHAVARGELLARDLLAAGHERLGPVDRHHQRPALVPLRRAVTMSPTRLLNSSRSARPLVVAEASGSSPA